MFPIDPLLIELIINVGKQAGYEIFGRQEVCSYLNVNDIDRDRWVLLMTLSKH